MQYKRISADSHLDLPWMPPDPTQPSRFLQQWIAVLVVAPLGYALIVLTHLHYTVDVVIGFLLAMLVWHLYHTWLQVLRCRCTYRQPHRMNRLVVWLEQGAEDLPEATNTTAPFLMMASMLDLPPPPPPPLFGGGEDSALPMKRVGSGTVVDVEA